MFDTSLLMGVKSAAASGGNRLIKRRSKAEVGGPSAGWWKECIAGAAYIKRRTD